jgi:predicted amidophosphoribosyltransferase
VAGPRDLDDLLARGSSRFPTCRECMYFQGGSAALCHRCASKEWQALADSDHRCEVCDLPFNEGERDCHNPVCAMSDRWFEWNYAIAMRSGALQRTINDYKYNGHKGWATIFGRILVGFLDANQAVFGSMDLLIPSPSFTGSGAHRSWNHIDLMLQVAESEGPTWPFHVVEPKVVIKTAETEQMVGKKYQERKAHAQSSLRAALSVPDPSLTKGKRIVVIDDVFTDGLTLNEVARALRFQGGAERVFGVTLVRQPWIGRNQT